MHLARLHVQDFRNYENLTLDLNPGVTVFQADNGSGKTNILEAIFYLSQLTSHRLGGHEVLVRKGSNLAQVVARVIENERAETYEVQLPLVGRRLLFTNKNAVSQARKFRNGLRVVLFAPEDLSLIREDPAIRRDELDALVAAVLPMDSTARPAFDKALKQRNSLLKALTKNPGTTAKGLQASLFDWDQKFVDAATDLIVARQQAIDLLNPRINEIYRQLTNEKDELTAEYAAKSLTYASLDDPSSIKEKLHAGLAQFKDVELARGLTMVGPHRDDIEITINNMAARTHASQGEAWSVALAWRVATFDLSLERHGSPPVLLLDDVFTQLDLKRRELLISRFTKADQVLITTAVASDVPQKLWNHQFEIKGGEVIAIA